MTDAGREVFIIDDEESVRHSLSQALVLEGFSVKTFEHAESALHELNREWRGVVVSDITMPTMDGLEFLQEAMSIDEEFAFVMLTGNGDISKAVESMKLGAYDFLEKPFAIDTMINAINKSYDRRLLVLENRQLREDIDAQSGPGPRIIGNSQKIKDIRRLLMRLKDADANILISGETGTGKELAARFLHDHSSRSEKPFITINCGAIPDDMIELELYGKLNASLSDENSYSMGKLISADGGTLLLDEVESMSSGMQLMLLRFLEEKVVHTIGANKPTEVDVRVITTTKVDLLPLVEKELFRQDLFYRLNVLNIEIPALRDRSEDIPLLFENFLRESSARYGLLTPNLSPVQSSWLKSHAWPGNVRELRNIAERFLLLGDKNIFSSSPDASGSSINMSLNEQVRRFEKTVLKDTLLECRGHLKKVQRQLDVPRKTLYEKLKKYNIEKNEYK